MIERSPSAMARLANDLLAECATELTAKMQEIEDLKFDNALFQVRIRLLELQIARMRRDSAA